MLSNKSASTCMTLGKFILLLPKGSSATSRAHWTMVLSFQDHPRLSSLCTPTLTGLAAQTPAAPPLAMRFFSGGSLVSWSSKRQPTVSRSSAEAEYHAVANGVAEATWLRQLLQELHHPITSACLVYCDNVSAVHLSTNPVQHQRTERVAIGAVRVLHVPTASQFADVFTKGLPSWPATFTILSVLHIFHSYELC